MTAACCGGIGLCIDVLCETGQNLLVPSPGFGLYKCLCEARGATIKLYQLLVKKLSSVYVNIVYQLFEKEGERDLWNMHFPCSLRGVGKPTWRI